jgi:hypothetical protein
LTLRSKYHVPKCLIASALLFDVLLSGFTLGRGFRDFGRPSLPFEDSSYDFLFCSILGIWIYRQMCILPYPGHAVVCII